MRGQPTWSSSWLRLLCNCLSVHWTWNSPSPHPHSPPLTLALTGLTACLHTAQCQVSPNLPTARATSWLARTQLSIPAGKDSSVAPQVHTGGTLNIASLWSAVVCEVWGGQERHYNIRMAWFLGSCHKVQHQLLTVNWSRLVAQLWTGYDSLQSPLTTAPSPSLCPLNPPACRIYFSLQSWASPGRALIVTKYYSNLPQGSMKWSYWDS